MSKVEDLKKLEQWVANIKDELQNLQNNVNLSEDEKKSEVDKISQKIDAQKQVIQSKIDSLKDKTDDKSKETKEKAESMLKDLDDLSSLKLSILKRWTETHSSNNSDNAPESKQNTPETPTEEKWFFWKTKDWVWEQWDDVWDKEKWKEEWWKNLLRTAWFAVTWIGAVALTVKWVKKIWNRAFWKKKNKEEKKESDEKESGEKKWFWDRWYGKTLKWGWITAWLAIFIKRLGEKFWRRKKDWVTWRDSDKEKMESYEKYIQNPENKENFENYENFWENIDILYWSIYDRELSAWYEDELEMEKIAKEQSIWEKNYKWIVPYCLDNQFKSVENILWQNSSIKNAIANWFDWMINYIKNKWNDFLQLFVDNYLSKLTSWTSLNLTWSLSEKIEKWRVKNKKSQQEMQYFFRQSIRIQTYLFEKRDQLITKIVKESSAKYGISEKDILWNDENFKKYVLDTPEYQSFNNSPISSAVTILRNYDIFDSEITEEKKEEVEELDRQRNEILWCKDGEKDILQIINEKKERWEALTEEENKALEKACDGIVKDIDDRILEAVEESARNIYWDLRWTEDSHLREYLDKSWLDKVFQSYKQTILQKKLELQEWKLSNEDKIALAESINAMLALKKEAALWSQTIEKDYDENGNIIYRVPGFLVWSIKNLVKWVGKLIHGEFLDGLNYITSAWLWTGLVITGAWVIYGIKTGKWWVAKVWAKITVLPAWIGYEIGNGTINMIKPLRDRIDKLNYPFKYWWEKWPQKLMDLLKDGQISLDKASEIVRWKTLDTVLSKSTEKRRKNFFGVGDGDNVAHKVFNKLVTEKSGTAVGSAYIQSMKDNGIYETLVKNYDSSSEIRRAISETASIDELKRVAELSKIPEKIRNNSHYQRLSSDLDLLEKQTLKGRIVDDLSNAEKKVLDNIANFRESLKNMDPKNIERTSELLNIFKWTWKLSDAIDQFTTLRKLEGKVLDTWLVDFAGNPIKKNLDDIIKNTNVAKLRQCKWMGLWVKDDAIEALAQTFESLNKANTKKVIGSADEIAWAIKTLVKFLAKAT